MSRPYRPFLTAPAAVAGMLVALVSVRLVNEQAFWMIAAAALVGLIVLATMRLIWLSSARPEEQFEVDDGIIDLDRATVASQQVDEREDDQVEAAEEGQAESLPIERRCRPRSQSKRDAA